MLVRSKNRKELGSSRDKSLGIKEFPISTNSLCSNYIRQCFPYCVQITCCCSVTKSCLTVCDSMDYSTPHFPVLHYLLEFAQTHVHWVSDALKPSHPLSPPSPPAFNLSQHQSLFQRLGSSRQVAKELMFLNYGVEKTLKGPLDCKEIKPVNPKGNQACIFIGKTDAKAETPILCLPSSESWLIPPDAGKDGRQEEKGLAEDEMVGWHHCLNGHGIEQTPGDSEGPGSLVCCSPWGHKESDMT